MGPGGEVVQVSWLSVERTRLKCRFISGSWKTYSSLQTRVLRHPTCPSANYGSAVWGEGQGRWEKVLKESSSAESVKEKHFKTKELHTNEKVERYSSFSSKLSLPKAQKPLLTR